MTTASQTVHQPKFDITGKPDWWHHHGIKAMPSEMVVNRKISVLLKSNAVKVKIRPISGSRYEIEWQIGHSLATSAYGRVHFTQDDLIAAFALVGLGDYPEYESSQWLLEKYGGHVAKQGRFIRFNRFLNIPCPGTANDGDPNVSIYLDDDVIAAVRGIVN
jgi:hypothetical protein